MSQPGHEACETVGVVLAGGRATRLGGTAAAGGKAALALGGRTFLEAVLAALEPHVGRTVVVAAHADTAPAMRSIAGGAPWLPPPEAATRDRREPQLFDRSGAWTRAMEGLVDRRQRRTVEIIHDTVPDGGPLAALADALRHVTAGRIAPASTREGDGGGSAAAVAAVVVSCDVPLLKPAVVGLLLARLRATAARWVVPHVLGHPQVLVSALDADLLGAIEAHLAAGRRDVRGLLDGLAAADPAAVCRLDAAALAVVDPGLESFRDVDTPEDLAAIERRLAGGGSRPERG